MIDLSTVESFFLAIEGLSEKQKILFRRSVGKMVSELDANTLMCFYRILPENVTRWKENRYLFAAQIHCLWKDEEQKRMSLIEALTSIKQKADLKQSDKHFSESFEKRIVILMDQPWDEDGFFANKYLNLVRFAKQKGYYIDGRKVLLELLDWNSEYKTVQRNWAKIYNNVKENEK